MAKYHLRLRPEVVSDVDGIFRYISQNLENPQAALGILADIDAAINSLSDNPYQYPKSYDKTLAAKGYHRILVHKYVIFYTINEGTMEVLVMRVLYGAMNFSEIL
jgi:plasmid stabilization system protein ParE